MEYTLIRSKRRTLSIQIEDQEIIVRAPNRLAKKHIDAFLFEKEEWINKKISEQKPKKEFQFEEEMLLFGKFYRLEYSDDYFQLDDVFTVVEGEEEFGLNFLKSLAKDWLKARVEQINPGKEFSGIRLSSAKGRWGSCSNKGNINLNWKLIFLPIELIDYIILHELTHLGHFDHSKEFWKALEKLDPNYKEHKRKLKEYEYTLHW